MRTRTKTKKRQQRSGAARVTELAAAAHVRLDHTAAGDPDAWDAALAAADTAADAERVEQAAAAGRVTLDGAPDPPDPPPAPERTTLEQVSTEQLTAVREAERVRLADIRQVCEGLEALDRFDEFARGELTGDQVLRQLWDAQAEEHTEQDETAPRFGRVRQEHGQTDLGKVGRGMSDALIQLTGSDSVARVQAHEREMLGEPAHRIDGREFRGMRASEMVRAHLSASGVQIPGMVNEEQIAGMMMDRMMRLGGAPTEQLQSSDWERVRMARAFEPWTIGDGRVTLDAGGGLPGAQGRDQFPNVLRDAMHRTLYAWYAGDSGEDLVWRNIVRVVSASDFRPQYHTFIGGLPNLAERQESGDFDTVQLGDGEAAQITARRTGQYIRISYETIVNDDLGRVMEASGHMGAAANRTVEDRLFDEVLNKNSGAGTYTSLAGDTASTVNLFRTARGNNLTGALTDDTLWAAWAALKKQKAIDGHGYVGFMGDTVLCETDQRGLFETILYDDRQVTGSDRGAGGPRNRGVSGKVKNLFDSPRVGSATRWYLFSSARRPIAASFVKGRDQPYLQQMEKWDMSGTCYFVALDFEVKALSDRGIMMSDGA